MLSRPEQRDATLQDDNSAEPVVEREEELKTRKCLVCSRHFQVPGLANAFADGANPHHRGGVVR